MHSPSTRIIATRRLAYTYKDDPTKRAFSVCIHEPFLVEQGMVDFLFDDGVAGCVVSFDGLPEKEMTVHGSDAVQALGMAVDSMEHYLRRLSKKYDFFFDDGEPYFED